MLRAALTMGKADQFEVVAVNDPFLDVEYMVSACLIGICCLRVHTTSPWLWFVPPSAGFRLCAIVIVSGIR